jgi:hypothetical protein
MDSAIEGDARREGTPASQDDVDEVRLERDALRDEVERMRALPQRRSRMRRIIAAICVVLSVAAFAAAVPGAWARRTVFNTDRYVALTSAIVAQPEVHDWLATRVTDAAFSALDVETRLSAALSDVRAQLAFLAGPITQAVRDQVHDRVEAVLGSAAFQRLWAEANTFAHAQIVAMLNGDSDTVSIQGDTVTLNVLPIVNEALRGLTGLASELVGRPVDLPVIEPDTVPTDALPRIESALGVDLPDDLGAIEVFDAAQLRQVQGAVTLFQRGVVALALLWVVALAIAIVASQRRRRTLLQAFVAFALILVVERRAAIATSSGLVAALAPERQPAGSSVMDVVLGDLLRYTAWLLTAALAVVIIALVTGPYSWARRARGGVRDVAAATFLAARSSDGPTAGWVAARRDGLMLGVAAVAIALLLFVDMSLLGAAIALLVLGGVELAIWRTADTQRHVTVP